MSTEPNLPDRLPPLGDRRRTIAFTSGKGGVGKSSIALNTGLMLAQRGRRVVLLDGDLGLASLNVLLGQSPRYDLRDVIAGEKRLHDIMLRGPYDIQIIPAGSGVAELANLGEEDREELLNQLREVEEEVDYLLIDTGAGISDTVLNLVISSDEAVVITRPEPTALADAYALIKVIVLHQPSFPFHILVNMVRDREQALSVYRSLSQILLKFLGYQPGYAGYVLNDPCVAQAVIQQVPFCMTWPRGAATRCLEVLANTLLGAGVETAPETVGFWDRVAGWGRNQG
jgi:flagellar biosynthesis protein FlhG